VKKRSIISLVAGSLVAVALPGVAAAQSQPAEGVTTLTANVTCDFGQGVTMPLPACELDEATSVVAVTFDNPAAKTGSFEGVQVANGVIGLNTEDGSVTLDATIMFSGTVEGCGAGTVYFKNTGSGVFSPEGVLTLDESVYEAVPGGTLSVTATLDESGELVDNPDGSTTMPYAGTYSCDEAAAAEGDAEDVADDAEAQAEDKADDTEDKADAKEDELEDKTDAKEDELEDKTDK
jgi:hypothetical protein